MLKVLVIGDEDVSLPFRAMGIQAAFASRPEQGRNILREAVEKDYGIIFIGESVARGCMDIVREVSENRTLPVITIIPDFTPGVEEAAERRLRELIRRAVGLEL